jgi:hypothetical protein
MTNGTKNHQTPVCPSCGEPVHPGFLRFKVSDKVKTSFAALLIVYVILSISILAITLPPQLRKYCDHYDYQHQPDYCKDDEFTLWVQPLNKEPVLLAFIGSGLAIGVLIFYWDWLQDFYENWQRKRGKVIQKNKKAYKHKCRHCGRLLQNRD